MSNEIQNNGYKNFREHGREVDIMQSHWGQDEHGNKIFIARDKEGNTLKIMHDANEDGFFETEDNIDEAGRVKEQLMDSDGDRQMDLYVAYDYDENGQETTRHIDYNLDGVTDINSAIDENGNITYDEIDTDGDGNIDLHVEYAYDENGNEIQRSIDCDGDGLIDVVSKLDGNGTIVSDDIDTDGDGQTDLHVNYVYDENGNEAQRIIDHDGDGNPDVISNVDENGRILSEACDSDGDGIFDTQIVYNYDENGEIIGSERRPLTKAREGTVIPENFRVEGTRIYGPDGQEIGVLVTTKKDGKTVQEIYSFGRVIPQEDTVTYNNGKYTTRDGEGHILTEDIDTDNDGLPDTHIEYTYENGEQTVSRRTNLKPAPEHVTIPPNCTVRGNRIFTDQGIQIGIIIKTIENGQEAEKIYHINQVLD